MKDLEPLQRSHEHDPFEGQLKQLVIDLYQVFLADRAQNINVYGTPYLGNRDLVQKSLVADGIGNFEAENIDLSVLKYLHMARRYRNGKRGLHLLNTYLRALWSSDYAAYQLYFKKTGVYPKDNALFSEQEIGEMKANIGDFVRTSRIRIELTPDGTNDIPSDVANSLDDTLPARLFIHDIVVKRDFHDELYLACTVDCFSYTREIISKVEVERAKTLSSRPYVLDTMEAVHADAQLNNASLLTISVSQSVDAESVQSTGAAVSEIVLRNVLNQTQMAAENVQFTGASVSEIVLRNLLTQTQMSAESVQSTGVGVSGVTLSNVLIGSIMEAESVKFSASVTSVILETN